MENIEQEHQRLKSTWIHKEHAAVNELNTLLKTPISKEASLADIIKRPEVNYNDLVNIELLGPALADTEASEQVEIQIKYSGYIDRQLDEIEKKKRHENTLIPVDFNFNQISGSVSYTHLTLPTKA